jgi:hypothetical protein
LDEIALGNRKSRKKYYYTKIKQLISLPHLFSYVELVFLRIARVPSSSCAVQYSTVSNMPPTYPAKITISYDRSVGFDEHTMHSTAQHSTAQHKNFSTLRIGNLIQRYSSWLPRRESETGESEARKEGRKSKEYGARNVGILTPEENREETEKRRKPIVRT